MNCVLRLTEWVRDVWMTMRNEITRSFRASGGDGGVCWSRPRLSGVLTNFHFIRLLEDYQKITGELVPWRKPNASNLMKIHPFGESIFLQQKSSKKFHDNWILIKESTKRKLRTMSDPLHLWVVKRKRSEVPRNDNSHISILRPTSGRCDILAPKEFSENLIKHLWGENECSLIYNSSSEYESERAAKKKSAKRPKLELSWAHTPLRAVPPGPSSHHLITYYIRSFPYHQFTIRTHFSLARRK